MEKVFFRVPTKVLLFLRNRESYVTEISKKLDLTYAYALKILGTFEDLGLASSKLKGRTRLVRLTPLGLEVAEELEKINRILKGVRK